MKGFFYKNRKWLGYFLYCLIVVTALLYTRFPTAVFRDYLESAASEMDDRVDLSVRELRLVFPPGVLLTEARLTLKDDPGIALFDAESVSLRPEWGALFFGGRIYHFKAEAYGGQLKGSVSLTEGDPAMPCVASLRADHIQIEQLPPLSRPAKAGFKGDLNGDILFKGRFDQIMGGKGQAEMVVSRGNLKLGTPFLGLDAIDFGQLSLNMNLENGRIRVVRVELKGDRLQGDLSGTINLANDLLKSRLTLKGNVEPLEGMTSGNPLLLQLFQQKSGSMKRSFIIQGTLGAPRFSFS